MAKKHTKTIERGRDAETGQFIPVDEARRKKTAVVEKIPVPVKRRKK